VFNSAKEHVTVIKIFFSADRAFKKISLIQGGKNFIKLLRVLILSNSIKQFLQYFSADSAFKKIKLLQEFTYKKIDKGFNSINQQVTVIKIYFSADSAFKKIKLLQESALDHHPTSVSCPTPARRRHRTTFTQV
jgi:hypothetical protein